MEIELLPVALPVAMSSSGYATAPKFAAPEMRMVGADRGELEAQIAAEPTEDYSTEDYRQLEFDFSCPHPDVCVCGRCIPHA